MKTSKRFNNAMTALINAFFNDTLAKDTCTACAVGNIVAYANGGKVEKTSNGIFMCDIDNTDWRALFLTCEGVQEDRRKYNTKTEIALGLRIIKKTGYSENELKRVEFAFESNTSITWQNYGYETKDAVMQDQYKGLCAIVDVLCDIEGLNANEYKQAFKYTNEFKPECEFVL